MGKGKGKGHTSASVEEDGNEPRDEDDDTYVDDPILGKRRRVKVTPTNIEDRHYAMNTLRRDVAALLIRDKDTILKVNPSLINAIFPGYIPQPAEYTPTSRKSPKLANQLGCWTCGVLGSTMCTSGHVSKMSLQL